MWKGIAATVTNLLQLAENVREDREELKEIRKELRDTLLVVERLQLGLEQLGEREERERQMLMLRMENVLLRHRERVAVEPRAALPSDSAAA